ncbi:nonstructural protein [Microviridae sp.]|nr:nonstructural protein [Microviridae sp.]
MMIFKIFTVRDVKSEAYLQPFFLQTTGLATREFEDLINNKNHHFNRHPADYHLFELGVYDDTNCSFDMLQSPKSLGTGLEYYKELSGAPLLEKMKKEV